MVCRSSYVQPPELSGARAPTNQPDYIDFYDWTPTGVTNFIMLAGSATNITDFDAWMARDWWRNLKSRYDL